MTTSRKPRQTIDRRGFLDEGLDGTHTVVTSIRCKILSHEDDLLHASRHKAFDLSNDAFAGTRTLLAPDQGNNAERTRLVTAFRDLDVRIGCCGCWSAYNLENVHV